MKNTVTVCARLAIKQLAKKVRMRKCFRGEYRLLFKVKLLYNKIIVYKEKRERKLIKRNWERKKMAGITRGLVITNDNCVGCNK
ncbi:MAG: hypothetical protein PUH02_07280 [bacterium]|nr:hypothetical protein [bacterium]